MKARTLKIESAGDYWRGQVTPKIRLAGQWLERAGFKPGNRVEVRLNELGKITLQIVADGTRADINKHQLHSATSAAFGELL